MIQNILIGTNALPPHIGGLENVTEDLALYLHKNGHNVTVVVSSDYGLTRQKKSYKIVTLDSFLLKRLPIPKITRRNFALFSSLKYTDFDQVILQSHLFVSNWILGLILRGNCKLTWISYGGGPVKHDSKIISTLIKVYEYLGCKILDYCSDRRLEQSEKSAHRLSKFGTQADIINNCLPDLLLDSTSRRGKIDSVRRVLFVGRFVEDKRLLELLEHVSVAFKKLEKLDSSIQKKTFLSIVGDGPLKERVIEFLKVELKVDSVVKRLPDRNSVINEMLSHDLLIQFPLSEGQPGVTLEALTVGLPILTTPIDECLQNLDGVFVSESDDFASKLVSLMTNHKSFEVDVEKNREHLRTHHSVSETTRRILEVR